MDFNELSNFFNEKIEIQNAILDYIDNSDDEANSYDSKSSILFDLIIKSKVLEDPIKLKDFLILLSVLCNNHQRNSTNKLFLKVESILLKMKDRIINLLDGVLIYILFHENNRMVLFLLKNSFFDINQDIIINGLYSFESKIGYFYPELRELNESRFLKAVNDYHLQSFIEKSDSNFDEFLKNRDEGENDSSIARIVRNDLIDDFIEYSEKTNLDVSNFVIERSIFETNYFLLKTHYPKLVDYSSFFGSIQIVKYLIAQNSKFPFDIWHYSVHGRNYEIIHLLEEKKILPNYFACFEMAIKCHHNEFADYFIDNLKNTKNKIVDLFVTCLIQRNYQVALQLISYFPEIFNDKMRDNDFYRILFVFIQNEYNDIVKLLIKSNNKYINAQDSIFF